MILLAIAVNPTKVATIERGRQEGELTAKLNAVPPLLTLGLSLEQIAQALELDIEQVRECEN